VRGQPKPRAVLPSVPPPVVRPDPAGPCTRPSVDENWCTTHDLPWGHDGGVFYSDPLLQAAIRRGPLVPRPLMKHFRVRVAPILPLVQRIVVSDAHPPRQSRYLTIQDAEYLIGQLQRAIKRAPRAR
jgi:hypothetical protein